VLSLLLYANIPGQDLRKALADGLKNSVDWFSMGRRKKHGTGSLNEVPYDGSDHDPLDNPKVSGDSTVLGYAFRPLTTL
jgi:hypothetical protein